MNHQEYVAYINRPFEGIDDMIARNCWSPKQSGYRPYRCKTEAETAIRGREIIYRGSSGFRVEIVKITESGCVTRSHFADGVDERLESFGDLFEYCKFRDNSYPLGLPKASDEATETRGTE